MKVEEANFTITAVPSGHMTEALTVSCLRVAFVYTPGGSSGIAAACLKEQKKGKKKNKFIVITMKILYC